MNKFPLTRREHDLLGFIRAYIREHDIAPTFQEMMAGVGLASKSGIYVFLRLLEDKGHITRQFANSRGIALVSAWEDIETAPDDGTEIILGDPHNSYAGYYSKTPNHWGEIGWYEADAACGMEFTRHPCKPTKWQPIPPPPEA